MPIPKKPATAKKKPQPQPQPIRDEEAAAAMAALLRTARREADAELYGAYCAGFSQALAGTSCAGLSPSEELDVREVVAYAMGLSHGTEARATPMTASTRLLHLVDVVDAVDDYMASTR